MNKDINEWHERNREEARSRSRARKMAKSLIEDSKSDINDDDNDDDDENRSWTTVGRRGAKIHGQHAQRTDAPTANTRRALMDLDEPIIPVVKPKVTIKKEAQATFVHVSGK